MQQGEKMEYMENENIYTLRKADFRKYIKTTTVKKIIIKYFLSSIGLDMSLILLTISMMVYSSNKNTFTCYIIANVLAIVLIILYLLFARLKFIKFLNKYEQEDFQLFHNLNCFFYYFPFIFFYRKKNYRNMFLLNMAYANIELGDFIRFEQCMALIYKQNAGRFKKMYGFPKPKEKLKLSLQKISPQSKEIKIAFEYLMKFI